MPNASWDRVWIGADLATMDSDIGIGHIPDGALAVRGAEIAWIGSREALAAMSWSANDVVDAQGCWITPGLIDCHTHLVYAGDRSNEFAARMAGRRYEDIARAGGGILSTVRATRAASEATLYEQSAVRARALLADGATTLEIKSGYGLDIENELKMLRVARRIGADLGITVVTTFLGAHTVAPEFAGRPDEYIDSLCEQMLPRIAREHLADAVDVFCEHIAFAPEQARRLFIAAQHLGLPLRIHADQLSDSGGAALAAEFKALSADHLEHASKASLERMAERGVIAGLLPGAFYFMRETRRPPIAELRSSGVAMAVSTDCNPGTSPIASLLSAMNMACVLFGLTPEEVLRGVTTNAARALGLGDDRGILRIGARADLARWRIRHPEQLCMQIGMHCPQEVVAAGKTLSAKRIAGGG